jgi:hypothetical protein
MSNHEDVMFNLQFFNVQFDVVTQFIKVHVVIDIRDLTKLRLETHDYFRFIHQFFDYHVNFRLRIHQFNDFNDFFNDNLCFRYS